MRALAIAAAYLAGHTIGRALTAVFPSKPGGMEPAPVPQDNPCCWPELRQNVSVIDAGPLLAGIDALRAADSAADVLALVLGVDR